MSVSSTIWSTCLSFSLCYLASESILYISEEEHRYQTAFEYCSQVWTRFRTATLRRHRSTTLYRCSSSVDGVRLSNVSIILKNARLLFSSRDEERLIQLVTPGSFSVNQIDRCRFYRSYSCRKWRVAFATKPYVGNGWKRSNLPMSSPSRVERFSKVWPWLKWQSVCIRNRSDPHITPAASPSGTRLDLCHLRSFRSIDVR